VREAIHALKYDRRRDVVPPLARLLAPQVTQLGAPIDFVTSVPLHPAREQARGYNQSELLAEQTARAIRSTYVRALNRTRVTADQIGLNASERRANVRDAFVAVGNGMAGKNVVLIDDVCTTGATLDACATALFQNGARAVYGLTVARPR
jgi:ComF family protein